MARAKQNILQLVVQTLDFSNPERGLVMQQIAIDCPAAIDIAYAIRTRSPVRLIVSATSPLTFEGYGGLEITLPL